MTQPNVSTAVPEPSPSLVGAGLTLPWALDFSAIEMTD